jgi:GNAT superfamily N-acetyltransferase
MDRLSDPILLALEGRQRGLGVEAGGAGKFRAEVAPFAALTVRGAAAFAGLASLMEPGEIVYLMGEAPAAERGMVAEELAYEGTFAGLQMMFPEDTALPEDAGEADIAPLSCAHGAEMVALTEAAFPGYFRIRTCEMGAYYGIRVDGRLVAMAGERMKFDRYVEVSGVCTLPGFTGRGYAAALISRLLAEHRRDGWLSYLHLGASNRRALELYRRLGFAVSRKVWFHRVVAGSLPPGR